MPGVRPSLELPDAGTKVRRTDMDVLWAGLAILLPALLVSLAPISTVDLGYGIRAGDLFIDGAGIQRIDTFTFTAAGLPWLNQQWLGQVLFAAAYRAGGWPALATFWTVVVVAIQALLWRAARSMGADARWAGLALLVGFVVAAQGIGLRAQVLGLLCLAALLAVGSERIRHPRAAWLAVPIVAVWANLHGSFAVGLALLGLVVVDDIASRRPPRTAVAVLVASGFATLINPFGIDAWHYVATIGSNPTIARFVTEWRHTSALDPAGAAFFGSVVAVGLLVAALARGPGRPRLATLIWLTGLAFLGAWAVRAIAWWGVGAPPAVAVMLTVLAVQRGAAAPKPTAAEPVLVARKRPAVDVPATRRPPLIAVAALALLVTAIQPVWRPAPDGGGIGARLRDAPPGIAAAVSGAADLADAADRPAIRVFNAQRWGSWLELDVPQAPVFADSRIELIPAAAWSDYVRVSEGDVRWAEILDAWKVDVVVVALVDQPVLAALIREDAGWRVIHEDADGVVAVRASAIHLPADGPSAPPGAGSPVDSDGWATIAGGTTDPVAGAVT